MSDDPKWERQEKPLYPGLTGEADAAGEEVYYDSYGNQMRTQGEWAAELNRLGARFHEYALRFDPADWLSVRPFADRIDRLWHPDDPLLTVAEVSPLLLDAYRPRSHASDRFDDDEGIEKTEQLPWYRDLYVQAQLKALLATAEIARGNLPAAEDALQRGFGGYEEVSGWIIQLSALVHGRLEAAFDDTERAFAQYWFALVLDRHVDLDLVLETLCELAQLAVVRPDRPSRVQWARLAMALSMALGPWRPGAWFDRVRPLIASIAK